MPNLWMRTTRREVAYAVDLRKARRWFDDAGGTNNDSNLGGAGQDDGQKPGNDNAPPQSGGNGDNRIEDLPQWAQELIRETRDEAAQRRIALKNEQEAARKREQARLAEDGKWKDLAEAREQELAGVKPYQERAEALEKIIRKSNEARIALVPEDMRGLIPTDYLAPEQLAEWLTANEDRLRKSPAPNIDAGAGGGSGQAVRLTADEQAMAKAWGMTPEQFAQKKHKPAAS